MKTKFLVTMIAFLFMGVGTFMAYALGKYGGFTNIPWYDVLMWTFQAVLGIMLLLILAVILLVYSALNGEEEPEPRRKRKARKAAAQKKPEIKKKTESKKPRKPGEKTGEKIEPLGLTQIEPKFGEAATENVTEEETPEELQTEEAVEHPAEWDEEEFE